MTEYSNPRGKIKDMLIDRVDQLYKEHSKLYKVLQDNIKEPEKVAKQLQMKLGLVTMRATYIEAQIYTIVDILSKEFEVDIKRELSSEIYGLYYIINNHAINDLGINNTLLTTNPEIEEQLKKMKDGFKKE